MIKGTLAVAATLVVGMTSHAAFADSYFNLRKTVDMHGQSYLGQQSFVMRDGGVKATFSASNGVFSHHALPLAPQKRGLGLRTSAPDSRPNRVNIPSFSREVIRIRFSKAVSLSSINFADFRSTRLGQIELTVRGGGKSQKVDVSSDPARLADLGPVRKVKLSYIGRHGGLRLSALRVANPIAGNVGGGGDDGDPIGGGNPEQPYVPGDPGTPGNPGDPGNGVVVPVPAAAWMGLALLGGMGGMNLLRRRRNA